MGHSSFRSTAPALHIADLFETAVDAFGNREALIFGDRRWTYARLHQLVDAARVVLQPAMSTRGDRIAIVGRNHPAYVIGYLAAQMLGASTVEIGADESPAAILDALDLAQPRVVLTDRADLVEALRDRLPVYAFDPFLNACESFEPMRGSASRRRHPQSEASVVFTSGTTGTPKGVVLTQSSVLHVNAAICDYLQLTSDDRYGILLPLCHTYGKSTLLATISVGATAVFLGSFQDPRAVFETLRQERCTVLSVVPFHLNVIIRRAKGLESAFGTLRAVTTSGGPLSADTARAFTGMFPRARLHAMYGLTETSTRVCQLDPQHLEEKPGSVGTPLPGVEVQIRDDAGVPLPPQSIGQIVVRGPNVMRGYLGDADLTARTLVDGWLMTGDLGRIDAGGFLWIEGRQKELIKVAGERISPVEVEQVLLSHPGIQDAAVIGVPDALLGEVVSAHVVSRDGSEIAGLGNYCAAHLSHHKIPRRFRFVPSIPRTATGKVRRFLLQQH